MPKVEQTADVHTKVISIKRFSKLKDKLNVNESPFCLRGSVREDATSTVLVCKTTSAPRKSSATVEEFN